MFVQRRSRNFAEAFFTTLILIHHQTVYNLRTGHRNALVGLLFSIFITSVMILAFMAFFLVIGSRVSPVRGDYMLFIMSGVFLFMTHVTAVGAVSSTRRLSAQVSHEPLNTTILVAASALAALYRQTLAAAVILGSYHVLVNQIEIDHVPGTLFMYVLAWFSGICTGLVLQSMAPWLPKATEVAATVYQRVNMISSGKMFLANNIPNIMLPMFIWCPLFHIIDQSRGFIFINYMPQKTSLYYPIWFSLAALVLGLLINFTTHKYESVSWSAGG